MDILIFFNLYSFFWINIAKLFYKKSLILIVTDVIDGCQSDATFPNQIIQKGLKPKINTNLYLKHLYSSKKKSVYLRF